MLNLVPPIADQGSEALQEYRQPGACIAAYTVVDANGVRAAPSALSYIGWSFLLLGLAIAGVFAWISGPGFVATVKDQWKPGVIAGMLSIITYGCALYAYRLGSTAPLAALRETSILFATLIAVFWLKEKVTPLRAAASTRDRGSASRLSCSTVNSSPSRS